jgi:hypothetical protein
MMATQPTTCNIASLGVRNGGGLLRVVGVKSGVARYQRTSTFQMIASAVISIVHITIRRPM